MTIRAFADKYEIPYHIAFDASFGVHPVSTVVRTKDFPEEELYHNLLTILMQKWERHNKQAQLTEHALRRVLMIGMSEDEWLEDEDELSEL